MHRPVRAATILLFLFALSLAVNAWAQDNNQTIPVTMPPSRRIEPPQPNATVNDLEERGDELRAEKAYLDAMDYYEAALKKVGRKDLQAAVFYNKIGITQLQLTRYYDARKSFQKAVAIDHKNSEAMNNLGVTLYHDKKYGRAIKYYKRAIVMESDSASYHSNLGSAYFSKKDLNDATAEYAKALQLDPNIFERNSKVGIVLQMSSPEDRAHFSYLLARMYAQMGQLDRSLLYLRRAMEEGYKGINEVYQDSEFAQLRKDQRFVSLMAQPPLAIP
jgi:tetratricopeptide (TPR) repeat protein